MTCERVLRYSAFPADRAVPGGGNPAGLVLDAGHLDAAARIAVAADVGDSETAFLAPFDPGTCTGELRQLAHDELGRRAVGVGPQRLADQPGLAHPARAGHRHEGAGRHELAEPVASAVRSRKVDGTPASLARSGPQRRPAPTEHVVLMAEMWPSSVPQHPPSTVTWGWVRRRA